MDLKEMEENIRRRMNEETKESGAAVTEEPPEGELGLGQTAPENADNPAQSGSKGPLAVLSRLPRRGRKRKGNKDSEPKDIN